MEKLGHDAPADEQVYKPPELIEIGSLATATLANGLHLGKIDGGSDAFVMRGHGSMISTSA
jgi:hypothetical protein